MPNNKHLTIAYVGLGSNEGDTAKHLNDAISMLEATRGIKICAVSPTYVTEPQGIKEQTWFSNQVIRIECTCSWTAQDLLKLLQDIESKIGRIRPSNKLLRNGPRCIDLDLLMFGNEKSNDSLCTIPHPRMTQRAFVLIPLRDVCGQDILPFEIEHCLAQIKYKVLDQKIYQE